MDQLDLDVNNYSINDIERFFKFKSGSLYKASDVELRETEIRQQLLDSGHVNKKMKADLIAFLTKAKNVLISAKCEPPKQPTVIPQNYQLDKDNYPRSNAVTSRVEDLVTRPETEYIMTQSSDFLPGKINPLKTRVISKCLTIDTRFRDHYFTTTSTDFTFQMPLKLNKVVSMQMSSFEIPVSFYGISSSYGNNFLYVGLTHLTPGSEDDPVFISKIINVPEGNYNAQDLISTLNNLICPRNLDGTIAYPNDLFSYIRFSLNITDSGSGTGKVTIDTDGVKSNHIQSITLNFNLDKNGNPDSINISSKLGWNLGFTKASYTGNCCYVSETLIEPASIRYIYLAVDDFNNSVNNHFITAFNQSILNPNILARISIKGTYFSLLMENDLSIVTEPRIYFGPVDIQRLRIRLFDDHGRILDMNGANFSFCLVFKILYDL